MRFVISLLGGVLFLAMGMVFILFPEKVKNHTVERNKSALKAWTNSEEHAERWVKKHIDQNNWWYRLGGIIMVVFALLLLYAVIRTLLKS